MCYRGFVFDISECLAVNTVQVWQMIQIRYSLHRMKKINISILIIFLTTGVHDSFSQGQPVPQKPMAPATLPGKGLAQFDFFYAGEGKVQNMYMVRKGKVVWSYQDIVSRGEISDAVV